MFNCVGEIGITMLSGSNNLCQVSGVWPSGVISYDSALSAIKTPLSSIIRLISLSTTTHGLRIGASHAANVVGSAAFAEESPNRPILVVSPFATGTTMTSLRKPCSGSQDRRRGSPFVLENRPALVRSGSIPALLIWCGGQGESPCGKFDLVGVGSVSYIAVERFSPMARLNVTMLLMTALPRRSPILPVLALIFISYRYASAAFD